MCVLCDNITDTLKIDEIVSKDVFNFNHTSFYEKKKKKISNSTLRDCQLINAQELILIETGNNRLDASNHKIIVVLATYYFQQSFTLI